MTTESRSAEVPEPLVTKAHVEPSDGRVQTAGVLEDPSSLRHRKGLQFSSREAVGPVSAQVAQPDQAQNAVLPGLETEPPREAGRGQHCRRGAPEVGVDVLEVLEIDGRVGVDRVARRSRRIGMQRENAVAPVVTADVPVVIAVAGHDEKPSRHRVVYGPGSRPDRRLDVRAVRSPGFFEEMHGLVAAGGVEDVLHPRRKADRRHVSLIIALISRVAAVADIQERVAGGTDTRRQVRRALLVERFGGRELGPTPAGDLDAAPDAISVGLSVQTVAVDEEPVGIDGRRRRGVADVGPVVDLAGAGRIGFRPHARSGPRVERHQVAGHRHAEEKVPLPRRGRDVTQVRGRAVTDGGERHLEDSHECRDVRGAERRFERVVAAVERIPVELQPVVGIGRNRREQHHDRGRPHRPDPREKHRQPPVPLRAPTAASLSRSRRESVRYLANLMPSTKRTGTSSPNAAASSGRESTSMSDSRVENPRDASSTVPFISSQRQQSRRV